MPEDIRDLVFSRVRPKVQSAKSRWLENARASLNSLQTQCTLQLTRFLYDKMNHKNRLATKLLNKKSHMITSTDYRTRNSLTAIVHP